LNDNKAHLNVFFLSRGFSPTFATPSRKVSVKYKLAPQNAIPKKFKLDKIQMHSKKVVKKTTHKSGICLTLR